MRFLTGALVLTLALAGCGDDSGGASGAGVDEELLAEATESGARAAAEIVVKATLDEEYEEVYAMLSPDCREDVAYEDFAADLADSLAEFFSRADLEESEIDDLSVSVGQVSELSEGEAGAVPNIAKGTVIVGFGDNENPYTFVHDDDRWWATCDPDWPRALRVP